ncbi:MAG: histone deacetylase [Lysobacterales bacterium]
MTVSLRLPAFYSDCFELPLPDGHRFPMAKYRLLRERVQRHADELGVELLRPPRASDEALCRVHDAGYVASIDNGSIEASALRRIGFPWSPQMAERSRRVSGASMAAAELACERGLAVNLAGGTHHAQRARGGGYCIFNDTIVAARHAQALGLASRVLVVDLDVHQGNGTAALVRDDPSIFSLDLYAARNYPAFKEVADLAVPLPDGCEDEAYLQALTTHLPQAFERSQPELVFYLAGADPYVGDRLGYLSLTKSGLAKRDRCVIDSCRQRDLPLVISMAGGYAERVEDIVDIHFETVRLASSALRSEPAGMRAFP